MRYDAIVIGGSYAGLSASMQLALANRSVCVLDTGTPRNRFAAASHGFFGQDGESTRYMIANARSVPALTWESAEPSGATISPTCPPSTSLIARAVPR